MCGSWWDAFVYWEGGLVCNAQEYSGKKGISAAMAMLTKSFFKVF